jgi:hypothetical protein
MMRRGSLQASGSRDLLPSAFRGSGDGGGELLAERLHALAVQRLLPAFGYLLKIAGAEPLPLRAGLGMLGDQIRPPSSCFAPQRLTLGEQSRREAAQGHEPDDARGGRLLRRHASASSPLAHRILARTDVCQRMVGRCIPD